MKVTESIYCRR